MWLLEELDVGQTGSGLTLRAVARAGLQRVTNLRVEVAVARSGYSAGHSGSSRLTERLVLLVGRAAEAKVGLAVVLGTLECLRVQRLLVLAVECALLR